MKRGKLGGKDGLVGGVRKRLRLIHSGAGRKDDNVRHRGPGEATEGRQGIIYCIYCIYYCINYSTFKAFFAFVSRGKACGQQI